jgi:hypothetical protein
MFIEHFWAFIAILNGVHEFETLGVQYPRPQDLATYNFDVENTDSGDAKAVNYLVLVNRKTAEADSLLAQRSRRANLGYIDTELLVLGTAGTSHTLLLHEIPTPASIFQFTRWARRYLNWAGGAGGWRHERTYSCQRDAEIEKLNFRLRSLPTSSACLPYEFRQSAPNQKPLHELVYDRKMLAAVFENKMMYLRDASTLGQLRVNPRTCLLLQKNDYLLAF